MWGAFSWHRMVHLGMSFTSALLKYHIQFHIPWRTSRTRTNEKIKYTSKTTSCSDMLKEYFSDQHHGISRPVSYYKPCAVQIAWLDILKRNFVYVSTSYLVEWVHLFVPVVIQSVIKFVLHELWYVYRHSHLALYTPASIYTMFHKP